MYYVCINTKQQRITPLYLILMETTPTEFVWFGFFRYV
nr:MAG TPA: hypothetical protein [Crassvirales sp.]